jgi:uncharacterized protein (DUF885 family)
MAHIFSLLHVHCKKQFRYLPMSSFLSRLRRHKLLLAFLPALIFLFCSVFYYEINHSFVAFCDTVFRNEITENTLNLHYTLENPEILNLSDPDVSFGSMNPEVLADSFSQQNIYLEKLFKFPKDWLSTKNRLTYDILTSAFSLQAEGEKYLLYDEPLGPSLGTQAQLPVLLAEYSFHNKKDIETYLALLSGLPEYYDSILQFERAKSAAGLFMDASVAQGVIDQCDAFLKTGDQNILFTTFDSRIASLDFLNETEKQKYCSLNRKALASYVIPTYRKLSKGISALKDSSKNALGLCYLPDGKNYYAYLVKDTTGCYDSVETIFKRIQSQLVKDIHTLRQIAQKNPQLFSNSGDETLKTVNDQVSSDPKEILNDLKRKMAEDFPEIADVTYEVKYVEKALEDYLSPAFYLTAPLDNRNQNVIYINPKIGYRGLDLYSTLAHEGYPGHLYQTIFSNDSGIRPVRSLTNFGGYVEGWATYVEMQSFSYGCSDNIIAEIYRLNRSLNLGISSFLDILIHYYGYDRSQTAKVLSQFGLNGEGTADAFFNTILEAPANYLKYYVGYLCFEDLKQAALKKEGASFSLKNFHKKILETGPCPFPILYKYVLQKS